jgi:hypothetical protein
MLALPSANRVGETEMDALQDADIFDLIAYLRKLRVRTRINLGWDRVRCRYLETHRVCVEVQRHRARG